MESVAGSGAGDGSCRDLSERSGAAWNPLQGVEHGSGLYRDLSESSNPSVGAWLGHLMEWDGSLLLVWEKLGCL